MPTLIEDPERVLALRAGEAEVLRMVASGQPLKRTLTRMAEMLEALADGMMVSILLVEDGLLRHAAAPSLPDWWCALVDGAPIGENQGSCGTAAWLKEPVIVADIANDHRWLGYWEPAARAGFRACWSTPIMADDTVVGTFALYDREPRLPSPRLLELIANACHLASVVIVHDQHQAALIESRRHLSLVYDYAANVLFDLQVEPDGYRFVTANPAFYASTGLTGEQVVGRMLGDVVPEPSGSTVAAKCAEAIRTGQIVRWEESTTYAIGTRTADVSITPVFDGQGRPKYLVGSAIDITERRRIEAHVRELQKLEAIGRLASGVAHDFNNILGVIVGVGGLLARDIPDQRQRAEVEEIIAAGERGAALTRQLLAFGRRQLLSPEVLDLAQVVGNLEFMLRRLLPTNIALEIAPSPGLPTVEADPSQLEQVVLNLVVNARDAMPDGGRVAVSMKTAQLEQKPENISCDLPPGRYVVMTVADNGHGMSEETQARIFDPFYTTRKHGKGTGLGLATVLGIVGQSGGAISVDSAPGQGAKFKVFLPASAASLPPRDAAPPAPRTSGETRRAGIQILVVEDDPALRKTIERMLRRLKYDVRSVSGADEALALLTNPDFRPDLLISDVMMPGMSGRELAERLKTIRPGLRVLLMSGYAAMSVGDDQALDAAIAFLPKPFTFNEFARVVDSVVIE